jgi:hypothetical protein
MVFVDLYHFAEKKNATWNINRMHFLILMIPLSVVCVSQAMCGLTSTNREESLGYAY